MTKPHFRSSTGLYTIRFKKSILHEGITHDEASDLINYYQERYDRMKESGWPLEPEHIHVEQFSGNYVTKPNKK